MERAAQKDKKRFRVWRWGWKCVRLLLKTVAILLICCIGLAALAACTTGSVLLADVVRDEGGKYYTRFQTRVVAAAKKIIRPSWNRDEGDERKILIEKAQEMAGQQAETDALLLAELESGAYTPDAPFVLVNPYGNAPLSALVMFRTEAPARVSVRVAGDTALAGVEHGFSEYSVDHMIPIYGLYAGRVNVATLALEAQDGAVREVQIEIETEALPDALAHETVRAHLLDAENYAPGFTFTHQGNRSKTCKAAIDVNGAYRWYLDTSQEGSLLSAAGYCGNYNGGESIYVSCGNREYGPALILELNFLGKLLGAWYTPYGVHHDISLNGDCILTTGSAAGTAEQTLICEIDAETGEIVSEVDYGDILQAYRNQTRNFPEASNFYSLDDWCHINTVTPWEGDLIISSRHQSTVMRNDREGNIKWMLCDPTDYYAYYQQYILTPVGENFSYPYIQHAPAVMPDQDGDPDTVDILLLDNGDFRRAPEALSSRMVQYRINEREMTVELIWEYGGDRTELYSPRHGDADCLENGNRLGSFEPYDSSVNVRSAYAIEVTAEGEPVWECWRVSNDIDHEYSEYRLERLDIYADGAEDLHIGEAARLFLPELEGESD